MAGRTRRRALAACAALAAAGAIAPAQASADTHVAWTALLPAAPVAERGYSYPPYDDSCRLEQGEATFDCVERTIDEMRARYDELLASCDHRGLFALAYLRTTEEYLEAAREAGFFADVFWVNREDTVFADLYFDHFDNWAAGRVEQVPAAWRVAFEAAEERSVSGLGDVLLGISSHINRDLPYTVAVSGLFDSQGRSRKRDHDRVNDFLVRVPDPLFQELRREWDPSIAWFGGPQVALAIGVVQGWREQAWRFAEQLASAADGPERAAAEQAVERYALAQNQSIRELFAYRPGESSAMRDAHCAARRQAAG